MYLPIHAENRRTFKGRGSGVLVFFINLHHKSPFSEGMILLVYTEAQGMVPKNPKLAHVYHVFVGVHEKHLWCYANGCIGHFHSP